MLVAAFLSVGRSWVSEGEEGTRRDGIKLTPLALEDVQVRAADARSADLDNHVERRGDFRLGSLLHLEVLVVPNDTNDAHDGQ